MKNIDAKIIAYSCNQNEPNSKIVTFELTYPRFIHSEFLTHRVFSRNSASSRAIPFNKVLEQVETNPAMPEVWGVNEPGMQANSVLEGYKRELAIWAWKQAAKLAAKGAKLLNDLGLHKQIVNRVLEPFVLMRTIVTFTEGENWFHLRDHEDAQPEINILAKKMSALLKEAQPRKLLPGQWHTPYFRDGYWTPLDSEFTLEQALAISASCCAQVSYRKNDDSLEKALNLKSRLIGDGSRPCHASPFEHQATPMALLTWYDLNAQIHSLSTEDLTQDTCSPEKGTTHCDLIGSNYWSGNLKGWIQNRQLIEGHVCAG